MILFKKAESLSRYLSQQKNEGVQIGFVPTMGALHQGHISLIEAAKKENRLTVCSIFVNPTQFNNSSDFQHYPVTTDKDIEKLLAAGCDVLFLPLAEEIYPPGFLARHYDLGSLETVLEGHYRPGHFQGVCQVIERLLEIVQPNRLYLGAKDFQQVKVITRLLHLLGKQDEIAVRMEPTLRENDGLAMSSRNLRLSAEQRALAPVIYTVLSSIKEKYKAGNKSLPQLEEQAASELEKNGFAVDYLQIRDADTLLSPTADSKHIVVLTAAALGEIRLIDNLPLN
ncbi:MAG TPA: pantoate--beta-alanine ligase [Flavisolibacter sp.]|nr:pantoate--beta-alanine ligase [Flavisolibacter sp.]